MVPTGKLATTLLRPFFYGSAHTFGSSMMDHIINYFPAIFLLVFKGHP